MEYFWKPHLAVGIELLWTSWTNNSLSSVLCRGYLYWYELHVQTTVRSLISSQA